ncbi:diguanylate phosphodiesterase [Shouchella clausii]|uniref:Peptide ABC transporter substrate-binding protein n=1 Tax=Shouchella clausii TaxID=79880 RepID=A0A268NYZ9_SHOCL|nr:ABC transporter substrate-binding protein [Shouchella clausii]MCM3314491.1 ABC transporter substrate-binding protein [Psychrobacillus sp. MER TA 17]PAE88479.1 peptide ABC transporter substrate-binding protein [Shouchella clausii]PAE92316.1 peptide ABC transporter substrate-binding protein [Shouchella clausii]PAF08972.1 peptide ABC transporter substrate-binding protein [Shouchella clausii]GIN15446.1 diguanylate phosphodiesterase [Shouchella clausii]
MKKTALPFLLAASLFALGACGGGESDTASEGDASNGGASANADGTLTIGLSANPKTFDPVDYSGQYESHIIRNVADTLVVYNEDLTEIIPSLATEWEAADDLMSYTFKLRDDVYFQPGDYQDGRKMTAEDVKYSLERSANESALNRLRMVEEVEVINDTEVKLILNAPNSALLAVLTDAGNVIVPKEEVEGHGDSFGSHLVGTGPFTLEQWQQDQMVKLERHENYWGETPNLAQLNFQIIPDPTMMTNSLRSGDIDIATDVKGQDRELIEQDGNLELLSVPGLATTYLDLNNVEGPTADPKVREAIYKGTNVQEMVDGVYQWGGAEVSYLPIPRQSWGYDEAQESLAPSYDPEAAKELLAEAGYPDGFDTEIYVAESRVPYATIFQNQMAEIGVNVTINTVEWGTYSDIVSKGQAPMSIGGWTWYPDPDFYLYQLFHSDQIGALGNGKGYKNEEVDALLTKATSETDDQEERAAIYQEALELIMADVPRIELDNTETAAGVSSRVHGFNVSPDGSIRIVTPYGTNVSVD